MSVKELIAEIKSNDAKQRSDAWYAAGPVGADGIAPLAAVMAEMDAVEIEVARAAKNAMWTIVRYASRPAATAEEIRGVIEALHPLLGDDKPDFVRTEVLWMVSEIGGDESVELIAKVMGNPSLIEDARCALERIPGDKSLGALKAALQKVPKEFQSNVAQSLRFRGVKLDENRYPCKKLTPTLSSTGR